ncbi:hypothetical protein LSUE1_G003571, partial [Lachnellula suecica]
MRFTPLLSSHLFSLTYAGYITNRQFPPLPNAPAPTPPPSLKDNPSCQLVGEALAICGSLTPSFKDLPATSQAECLCYSSTIWAPEIFDSAVKYCADFASTAATAAYPAMSNLQGFCTTVGDITTRPASNSAAATSQGYSSNGSGNGPCGTMNNLMAQCANQTPGFASLQPADQAKCLCYPNGGSFAPAPFDNAVASCYQVAKTQAPTLAGDVNTVSLSSYTFASPQPTSASNSGSGSATETASHRDITITVDQPSATAAKSAAGLTKVTNIEVVA